LTGTWHFLDRLCEGRMQIYEFISTFAPLGSATEKTKPAAIATGLLFVDLPVQFSNQIVDDFCQVLSKILLYALALQVLKPYYAFITDERENGKNILIFQFL
jgi:hypothetical protein